MISHVLKKMDDGRFELVRYTRDHNGYRHTSIEKFTKEELKDLHVKIGETIEIKPDESISR